MIAGHYTTVLIAKQKIPHAPLWLLLFSAIGLDIIWIFFATIGLETPTPTSWLDATLMNMRVDMPYSHDLLPLIGWTFLFLILGWAVTREWTIGYWCAALVVVHWLCDFVVGFEHHVIGNDGINLGLNLYNTHPIVGLMIEACFAAICIIIFDIFRKKQGFSTNKSVLIALTILFVGGTLLLVPLAHTTLAEWFQIAR